MKKTAFSFSAIFGLILVCTLMLADVSTASAYEDTDVIGMVDSVIRSSEGAGSEYFETSLGDFAADALRAVSGADAAVLNGGELVANLQPGACTWADVLEIFEENKQIGIARITPAQLWEILEHGVCYLVLGKDQKTDTDVPGFKGFPQVSGINFKYDVSAPPGERIQYVLLNDEPVERDDHETLITVCATAFMLEGGYDYPAVEYESLGMGLADALAQYISANGTAYVPDDVSNRHGIIGTYNEPLISRPLVFVIALCGCVIAYSTRKIRSKVNFDTEPKNYD